MSNVRQDLRGPLNSLTDSIEQNFNGHSCERYGHHGFHEFICTVPNCSYGILVCADCLKTDPRHIQAHGPNFLRIRHLVAYLGSLNPGQNVTAELKKFMKIADKEEKRSADERAREEEQMRSALRKYESMLIDVVKRECKRLNDELIQAAKYKREMEREVLMQYLERSRELSSVDDLGIVRELDNILRKKHQNTLSEFKQKVASSLDLVNNFDAFYQDWYQRQSSFVSKMDGKKNSGIDWKGVDALYNNLAIDIEDLFRKVNLRKYGFNNPQDYQSDKLGSREDIIQCNVCSARHPVSTVKNMGFNDLGHYHGQPETSVGFPNFIHSPVKQAPREVLRREDLGPTPVPTSGQKPPSSFFYHRTSSISPSPKKPQHTDWISPTKNSEIVDRATRDLVVSYSKSPQIAPRSYKVENTLPEMDKSLREELNRPIKSDTERLQGQSGSAFK